MEQFILNENREPVPCPDRTQWGRWHHEHLQDCVIGDETIAGTRVSTRFIGLEMNIRRLLNPRAARHLFETPVFAPGGLQIDRYSTWEEAEKGHREAIAQVRRHQQS